MHPESQEYGTWSLELMRRTVAKNLTPLSGSSFQPGLVKTFVTSSRPFLQRLRKSSPLSSKGYKKRSTRKDSSATNTNRALRPLTLAPKPEANRCCFCRSLSLTSDNQKIQQNHSKPNFPKFAPQNAAAGGTLRPQSNRYQKRQDRPTKQRKPSLPNSAALKSLLTPH